MPRPGATSLSLCGLAPLFRSSAVLQSVLESVMAFEAFEFAFWILPFCRLVV